MVRPLLLAVAAVFTLVACPAPAPLAPVEGEGEEGEGEEGEEGEGEAAGSVAPGGACACDADCADDDGRAGYCGFGVCMTKASAACSAEGSTAECGAGSRCWPLFDGDTGTCWPDCAAHDCAGECDADGSCAPTQATVDRCDSQCAAICPGGGGDDCPANATATADGCVCNDGFDESDGACVSASAACAADGDCDDNFVCGPAGNCMLDVRAVPLSTVPACNDLPALLCDGDEAECGALVTFDPRDGLGYNDYPLNGETSADQYRSFIRRDLRQMITYAAAATACLGAGFPGNGGDLMLGDMSEADGSIPGTSDGQPGHPADCHERGFDMDIGYYQVNTPDNRLREVCDHIVGGEDQYHCVSETYGIDIWRTAMFLGKMMDHPQFRAAGVDGKAGDTLIEAAEQLCDRGFLDGRVCDEGLAVVYDRTAAEDIGWFQFHHHHFHVTILDQNGVGLPNW